VRENEAVLGNLLADFDFTGSPRPPLLLPVHPITDLLSAPEPGSGAGSGPGPSSSPGPGAGATASPGPGS
jgi:hypothetical protein